MLRELSFIFTLVGISLLLLLMIFPRYVLIENVQDLGDVEINEKVYIVGIVESEKNFGDFRILKMKGLEIVCNCDKSFLDEKIGVMGLVGEYKGEKQIRALKIERIVLYKG